MCRIRLIVRAESVECATAMMGDVQKIVILGKTPSLVRQFDQEVRAVFVDLPDDLASEPEHLISLLEQETWSGRPGMQRIIAQPVEV
jgi:hypothetical protein